MLYVKNMIFFDGATTRLAPDVNLFEQVTRIYGYFAQHHAERIVRDIGFDPRLLTLDLDGFKRTLGLEDDDRVAHPARAGRATAAHPGAAGSGRRASRWLSSRQVGHRSRSRTSFAPDARWPTSGRRRKRA